MPEVAITLKIVGAGEDYPRLLTGYRSLRGGVQIALALRPTDKRVLFAVTGKDGSGHLLHAVDLDGVAWPTAATTAAECIKLLKEAQKTPGKAGPIVMRGQWRGKLYVDVEAQTARVELVRKIASYGTLTLIGQNSGWKWRFERAAKWFSEHRRGGPPVTHQPEKTLIRAVQVAYAAALELVGQACGTRDTQRRQAHDPEYATRYPIREPKVRATEPLDRFKLPRLQKGRRPKKSAESCDTCAKDVKPLKTGGSTIPIARTAPALEKQATALKADAEGLATTATPKDTMSVDAVIDHFTNRTSITGYLDITEQIRDYARGTLAPLDRTVPLDDFIAQIREAAKKAREGEWRRHGDSNNVAAVYAAEDEAAVTALDLALRSAPVQLARARQLIRFAEAAVNSPKCSGPEEAEARQAIARAEEAYEDARKALVKGGEKVALKAIRQSAAWVALSASKIGASCKAGQKSLLGRTPAKKAAPQVDAQLAPGAALQARAAAFQSKPSASTAKAWLTLALSHRGMTASKMSARSTNAGVSVTVSGFTDTDADDIKAIEWLLPSGLTVKWAGTTTAKKAAPTKAAPTKAAPTKAAPRKASTPRKPRAKKAAPAVTPAMSATDAALMAAFQQAIKSAVGASA